MGLRQTVAPTMQPVTLTDVKRQGRVTLNVEDVTLLRYCAEATNEAERTTSRQLLNATYELTLEDFPGPDCPIYLERPPLSSVTSITYAAASDGTVTTLAPSAYVVDVHSDPGTVTPAWSTTWPAVRRGPGAVKVTYVAGYGATPATIPGTLLGAVIQMAATRHLYREDSPLAAESALDLYRVHFDFRVNDWRFRRGKKPAESWP